MKLKTWLYLEFHKDTAINEINPEVQTSSGLLILQQNGAWSGSFNHAKLFSRNKAQRICDKMNKRSMKYGIEHGKPYSVYNIITKRGRFMVMDV
jgi:hypothetical protein